MLQSDPQCLVKPLTSILGKTCRSLLARLCPFLMNVKSSLVTLVVKNSSCLALDIEKILNQAKSGPGAETPSSVRSYFKDLDFYMSPQLK